MNAFRLMVVPLAAAGLLGCGDSPTGTSPELQLMSVGTVVERLERAGARVDVIGPIDPPLYPATGTLLRVDGEELQVYEFDTAEEAAANSDSRPLVLWTGPPHFFHVDRVIAIYVGTTTTLLERLETVFGPEL